MLSVRTTATVRERPAETVKKAININQLFKNINSRKTPKCLRRKHQKQASDATLNNAKSLDQGKGSSESDSSSSSSGTSNTSSNSDQKNQQRDKNSSQRLRQPPKATEKPSIQIVTPATTIAAPASTQLPLGRLVKIPEEDPRKLSTTESVSSTEKQDQPNRTEPPEQWQQQQQQQNQESQQQQEEPKTKFLLPELNNFRKPPTVQVPVATILNDLSPVPAPAKVTNKISNSNPMSPMNPAGLQSNSPDVKAMR